MFNEAHFAELRERDVAVAAIARAPWPSMNDQAGPDGQPAIPAGLRASLSVGAAALRGHEPWAEYYA
jgi:hypothetical protein